MRLYARLGIIVLQALFVSPFACAQTLNSQQMEGLMNQYDKPSLWSTPQSNKSGYGQPSQFSNGYAGGNQIIRPTGYGAPQQQPVQNGFGGAFQQQQQQPVQKVSPFQALFGGSPKPPPPPPKPVNPLQYVMQQFLGGSSSGNPGQDSQKLYNAQEYLQTANDQASRAQNACERASYGNDKYARQQASSEAYYAAQAARSAADSATSAAAGGNEAANDAAAQARNAADRAQAAADRASSNANNGGGW